MVCGDGARQAQDATQDMISQGCVITYHDKKIPRIGNDKKVGASKGRFHHVYTGEALVVLISACSASSPFRLRFGISVVRSPTLYIGLIRKCCEAQLGSVVIRQMRYEPSPNRGAADLAHEC